jgi:hypothetical protein
MASATISAYAGTYPEDQDWNSLRGPGDNIGQSYQFRDQGGNYRGELRGGGNGTWQQFDQGGNYRGEIVPN